MFTNILLCSLIAPNILEALIFYSYRLNPWMNVADCIDSTIYVDAIGSIRICQPHRTYYSKQERHGVDSASRTVLAT